MAAISALRQDGERAEPVSDALLDAIAAARVGGPFWGHRPQGIRLVAREGVAVMQAALDGLSRQDIGIVRGGGGRAVLAGRILPPPSDLWAVIAGARSVHAAPEDELAIIAGLLDVPVFGPDGQRVAPDLLRQTARAAVGAARYRDCFSGEDVDAARAVSQLADWRRHLDGNRGIVAACGMAFWKREAIRHFLWDGVRSPPFLAAEKGLRRARKQGGALAVWPSRVSLTVLEQGSVTIARVEDGFLRSKGLGAALHPPGSVVVDRAGIYYDARRPSDMEKLLATHAFSPELEARAARLRAAIRASAVTKYGRDAGRMIDLPRGRRTVLAVGQVEDDLSVAYGGAGVAGNLDLLKRVRAAEPEAFIVYRPHPDVQAGLRKGHLSDAVVLSHADCIDTGSPLMELVQAVDEVHVLSSLTGFEALMRDRPVTVHGMPFYAGWGLTRDLAQPNARRGRQLTLDQLVAGALILYPLYLDPVTRLPCGPEVMVERLASGTSSPVSWLIRLRTLQGKLQRFMTLSAEYLHG